MLYYFTMGLTHIELRKKFAKYWQEGVRNHARIMPAPLVLQDDATTLFTSSGMQQLVPYLSGETHAQGKRLYNIQPCFRAVDIDEVGDNRHTTFFEMMGNWSLGDYFKAEQLGWMWEFFTSVIGLPAQKLHVTVFEGGNGVEKDEDSAAIWKKLGVKESHIHYYNANKNWWSRAGTPDKMPVGELGGPDSEVFYEFDSVSHDKKFGEVCHPNCDCGKFLEIGNSVFIQFRKKQDNSLEELPQKNVDYGGGLERILAASNNDPDIFKTDVFASIIRSIEGVTGKSYSDIEYQDKMRVIADHIKAAVFLIADGVTLSNKGQGYILRRFLRRAAVKLHLMKNIINEKDVLTIADEIQTIYDGIYFEKSILKETIDEIIGPEVYKFNKTLENGLRIIGNVDPSIVDSQFAFDLFQSYGFPFELTQELMSQKNAMLSAEEFAAVFEKHKTLSRTASAGMFKGGLADSSEQVVKYHTATHLLHQALRSVLGAGVRQEGSNITGERLRFDFSIDTKPTEDEIKKVEAIINEKINESLPVHFEIMPKLKAEKIGALSFFRDKYGEQVKVYFVGDYSKEFCGGPHVENTSTIGSLKITKVKKIGSNLVRIYAE